MKGTQKKYEWKFDVEEAIKFRKPQSAAILIVKSPNMKVTKEQQYRMAAFPYGYTTNLVEYPTQYVALGIRATNDNGPIIEQRMEIELTLKNAISPKKNITKLVKHTFTSESPNLMVEELIHRSIAYDKNEGYVNEKDELILEINFRREAESVPGEEEFLKTIYEIPTGPVDEIQVPVKEQVRQHIEEENWEWIKYHPENALEITKNIFLTIASNPFRTRYLTVKLENLIESQSRAYTKAIIFRGHREALEQVRDTKLWEIKPSCIATMANAKYTLFPTHETLFGLVTDLEEVFPYKKKIACPSGKALAAFFTEVTLLDPAGVKALSRFNVAFMIDLTKADELARFYESLGKNVRNSFPALMIISALVNNDVKSVQDWFTSLPPSTHLNINYQMMCIFLAFIEARIDLYSHSAERAQYYRQFKDIFKNFFSSAHLEAVLIIDIRRKHKSFYQERILAWMSKNSGNFKTVDEIKQIILKTHPNYPFEQYWIHPASTTPMACGMCQHCAQVVPKHAIEESSGACADCKRFHFVNGDLDMNFFSSDSDDLISDLHSD